MFDSESRRGLCAPSSQVRKAAVAAVRHHHRWGKPPWLLCAPSSQVREASLAAVCHHRRWGKLPWMLCAPSSQVKEAAVGAVCAIITGEGSFSDCCAWHHHWWGWSPLNTSHMQALLFWGHNVATLYGYYLVLKAARSKRGKCWHTEYGQLLAASQTLPRKGGMKYKFYSKLNYYFNR